MDRGLNKETLYYAILFGVAFVTILVLLILGIVNKNTGLIIYTAILTPVFLFSGVAALRYTLISKDTIYVEDKILVIKTFFITGKFPIGSITKLTAGKLTEDDVTSVNITTSDNTVNFKFKNITKEEIAQLRRVASK